MLWNHIQLAASVSAGPRPSPCSSHHEPVSSKSFTIIHDTTSDNACRMLQNFWPSKKCNSTLVDGKKLNIFSPLEGEHSQTRPVKLTPLMPLGYLNMRGTPSASQQHFLDAHCTVGKEKSFFKRNKSQQKHL